MTETVNAVSKLQRLNKSELLQYITVAVMLAALFVRNALGIDFPVIFLLGIMLIPIVFGNDDNIWATVVACIPFSTGFQYKYALFAALVIFVIRRRGKINLSGSGILILLMMLWELLHAFMGAFSLYEYLRCFAELLIVFIITGADLKNVNYKLVLRTLAICTVGVCFIMLYIQLLGRDMDLQSLLSLNYRQFRFGAGNIKAENFGLNFNANGLGSICCQAVAAILILYGRKEHRSFDICMAILAALFGFFTLSRAYIVCILFVVGFFVLSSSGDIGKRLKGMLGVACLALVVVFVIGQFFPGVYENLTVRFSEDDVLNGRDDLLVFYSKHIFSAPLYMLFGIGLQDFQEKLIDIYGGYVQVCHNGPQEVWVVWGIVGVVLFFGMILTMISESKRFLKKKPLYQYMPLFLMLLYSLSGQLIRSGSGLLALILIYVCLCIPKETEEGRLQ